MKRFAFLFVMIIAGLSLFGQPIPSDVVTIGSATASIGGTVDVPVYIRDVSGTPLGIDRPAGSRIQSYSITVNYPAASVQSITFSRAGITAPLTPAFESSPSSPGQISLIDSFAEGTNLIPFTSNAPAPGNQVGVLHLTLAPSVAAGSTVPLQLDSTLTQLSNQAGTTTETVTLGTLTLVAGAITVSAPVPALSPWALALLGIAMAGLGMFVSRHAA